MLNHRFARRSAVMAGLALFISFLGRLIGLNSEQVIVSGIFSISILGAILFWEFRLSFAFLGSSIMLLTGMATL